VPLQNVNEIYGYLVISNFLLFDQPVYLVPHLVLQFKREGIAIIIKSYSIQESLNTLLLYNKQILPRHTPTTSDFEINMV
jgi:hypothetical protein